jgi:hypothetical protein
VFAGFFFVQLLELFSIITFFSQLLVLENGLVDVLYYLPVFSSRILVQPVEFFLVEVAENICEGSMRNTDCLDALIPGDSVADRGLSLRQNTIQPNYRRNGIIGNHIYNSVFNPRSCRYARIFKKNQLFDVPSLAYYIVIWLEEPRLEMLADVVFELRCPEECSKAIELSRKQKRFDLCDRMLRKLRQVARRLYQLLNGFTLPVLPRQVA